MLPSPLVASRPPRWLLGDAVRWTLPLLLWWLLPLAISLDENAHQPPTQLGTSGYLTVD
jgi:hypothetical protein